MTRSMEATPVPERTLLVESIASPRAREAVTSGLPRTIHENEVVLFVGYTFAEVPVGTTFDCCYMAADESNVRWVRSEVVAVTQQFARPWDEMPHGWKTITVLRFDPAVPDLVAQPISILISSRETWHARQGGPAAGMGS
jgi:hypothetical protein